MRGILNIPKNTIKELVASFKANPMKDDMGRYRISSLFWEARRDFAPNPKMPPIWSTKDNDHTVDGVLYPSLKAIYMKYEHIPGFEYDFAIDMFNSWDHWEKLTKSSLSDMFQGWRDELDIRIKSSAIKAVFAASRNEDATGVVAAKYLADKGYVQSTARKAGRPSSEEVERERKIEAGVARDLHEDMKRLGMSVAK